jgi:MFS family permease
MVLLLSHAAKILSKLREACLVIATIGAVVSRSCLASCWRCWVWPVSPGPPPSQSNVIALVCISVVIFLANASSPSAWALATAAAPSNRIASLGSLQNFGGFLGGALAPIVTGYIAQSFSFVPAVLTGATIAFLGALSYLFLVHKPIPAHEAASHGAGLRAAE